MNVTCVDTNRPLVIAILNQKVSCQWRAVHYKNKSKSYNVIILSSIYEALFGICKLKKNTFCHKK